jgi:hypothetical protein
MEGLALLILFLGMFVIAFIIIGIMNLYYSIKEKKWNKWVAKTLAKHPELKVLLSEYHRLRNEEADLYLEIGKLRKDIDSWVEKNKYLPEGHRVDAHIEQLKEFLYEQEEIAVEYRGLVTQARQDLEDFWENNYPNIKEEKRIMWLE